MQCGKARFEVTFSSTKVIVLCCAMLCCILLQVMIKALQMGVEMFAPLALVGCAVCKYQASTWHHYLVPTSHHVAACCSG
jgi:hypothetical protein